MERETFIIETPNSKQKIVLKSWLTFGEKQQIDTALIQGVKFGGTLQDMQTDAKKGIEFDATALAAAQNKALETVIISIDGKTDNILQAVQNMRVQDATFIIQEIDKITNVEEIKKK